MAAETGRQLWEAAAAYWAAREVLSAAPLFEEVDRVAWSVSTEAETAMRDSLSSGLGRLARWYLTRLGPFDPGVVISSDRPFVAGLSAAYPFGAGSPSGGPFDDRPLAAALVALGLPGEVAARLAQLVRDAAVGELAEAARASEREVGPVASAYAAVEEGLSLVGLERALSRRDTSDLWERWELDLLADDLARSRVVAVTRSLQSHPDFAGADAARQWLAVRPGPLAHARDLIDHLGPEPGAKGRGQKGGGRPVAPASGPHPPCPRRGRPGLDEPGGATSSPYQKERGPGEGSLTKTTTPGSAWTADWRTWSAWSWYGPGCPCARRG